MTLPTTPFDDVRLPEDIEQGALIGPMFQTTIVPLSNGGEQRNADWAQERIQADISYGIMQKCNPQDISDSYSSVMNFYRARMGRFRGFRFRDWTDFEAIEEPLIKLTDFSFLLNVGYDGYDRVITRVVENTLEFPNLSANSPYVVHPGGLIIFNAAQPSDLVASFEFDVPVRFNADLAQVNLTLVNAGTVPSIKLIGLREDYDHSLIVD